MMPIDKTLLQQSKLLPGSQMRQIECTDNGEKLIPVEDSSGIQVRPIWVEQIDPHEGKLYAEYILSTPKYRSIYVRQVVLAKIKHASELLPPRYKLIVRAGHRPLAVQKKLLNELIEDYRLKNPGASYKEALEFARTYVSDPDILLPPHCCGAAVDVDLYDSQTKSLVDFGCPMNTDAEIAHLHSANINKEQYKYRLLLLSVMLRSGFASNVSEWWHYSYGDQRWAWFYQQKNAIYELIEPKL